MATENHRAVVSFSIFVLIAVIMPILRHGSCVEADKHKHLGLKHKGTVKTIKSGDGDVIDCVDIYKQPAFDNPLIKDLQMEPSSYPNGMNKMEDFPPELIQDWRKNGECPEGTIPILRIRTHRRSPPVHLHGRQLNHSFAGPVVLHQYATVSERGSTYRGAYGSISVWEPWTEASDFSLSQIWVVQDHDPPNLNTVEAGWIRDSYRTTGCYDLGRCGGFVQTNRRFLIGGRIEPISVYNGQTNEIIISIFKDSNNGNWWLSLQGFAIGYWPGSIVPGLANGANAVHWGGEITGSRPDHHTTTQMGSGHFSFEGFGKSGLVKNIGVVDSSNIQRDAVITNQLASNPKCYDLNYQGNMGTNFGSHFYYGGPGYSAQCP
ncbi:Very-long-chain 3-oxoacyl-CoA reductase [Actinidia chinensis var. chinensis]|uniref:Very-long-chain 3-oxoacyl-CoA reductase n=1 Tax=Actinidia chinensis var. chinensis TaxID=1590841 RepID=A0A2R6PUX6_ACTCC|nr:Very-long-chain 3-oxoacyl-CoA reductase [Actinidia chinensis var. chinensis]